MKSFISHIQLIHKKIFIVMIGMILLISACSSPTPSLPGTLPINNPPGISLTTNPPGIPTSASDQKSSSTGPADPSAVYCTTIMGYKYETISGGSGQSTVCKLPNDEVCGSWDFLIGKCGQKYSYCATHDYEIKTLNDGKDPFSPEYGVCVSKEGKVIGNVSELSGLKEKSFKPAQ